MIFVTHNGDVSPQSCVLVFILQSVVAVCDFVILVFECLIPRRRGVKIQFDRP